MNYIINEDVYQHIQQQLNELDNILTFCKTLRKKTLFRILETLQAEMERIASQVETDEQIEQRINVLKRKREQYEELTAQCEQQALQKGRRGEWVDAKLIKPRGKRLLLFRTYSGFLFFGRKNTKEKVIEFGYDKTIPEDEIKTWAYLPE
jgi:DNA repair exonuclease SbcCD ATPase subunit